MISFLTVLIPTYNPIPVRLNQTLAAIKAQTLATDRWELLLIDNNSTNSTLNNIDLTWHPASRIVREPTPGLSNARRKGFKEAKGELLVMIDDDNRVDVNYLANIMAIFNEYPEIGAAGGKSLPEFETEPPVWLNEFYGSLALRDLGDDIIIERWENHFPSAAPIGAGMAIRTAALTAYMAMAQTALLTDRTGTSLFSGGDNEIIISILKSGWHTGYFPQLILRHIIPAERMQVGYIARLIHDTNVSWVQLLEKHGINPWAKIHPATLGLRKIKAWLGFKAWQNASAFIRWQGACGLLEGLAKIK
jgi:glycosyltransferase involved in cell wall biosynthesis